MAGLALFIFICPEVPHLFSKKIPLAEHESWWVETAAERIRNCVSTLACSRPWKGTWVSRVGGFSRSHAIQEGGGSCIYSYPGGASRPSPPGMYGWARRGVTLIRKARRFIVLNERLYDMYIGHTIWQGRRKSKNEGLSLAPARSVKSPRIACFGTSSEC